MDEQWFQTGQLVDSLLFKRDELPSLQQVQLKLVETQQKLKNVEPMLLEKQQLSKKIQGR